MITHANRSKFDLPGAALAAGFGALAFALLSAGNSDQGAQIPSTIEAQEFVVQDTSGTPRATLGIGKDGTAALKLLSSQKKTAVVTMGVTKDGQPFFEMRSPTSKCKIVLSVKDDVPRFQMLDRQGKRRLGFRVDAKDGAMLTIANKKEHDVLTCNVSDRGHWSLEVRDAFGETVKKLGDR